MAQRGRCVCATDLLTLSPPQSGGGSCALTHTPNSPTNATGQPLWGTAANFDFWGERAQPTSTLNNNYNPPSPSSRIVTFLIGRETEKQVPVPRSLSLASPAESREPAQRGNWEEREMVCVCFCSCAPKPLTTQVLGVSRLRAGPRVSKWRGMVLATQYAQTHFLSIMFPLNYTITHCMSSSSSRGLHAKHVTPRDGLSGKTSNKSLWPKRANEQQQQ
ncbi:uncharacterized protein B0I36DRAFT_329284 [Microdochium trichocladiopsis]|uniref:Uncharacterized protein n=1 Tax=Microdochium trichocladiopsis TaxID=1682393 RepID=A0A9P9BQG7_9PEZI|nr:uncharacterized protein B0I36DRAFT_329284 [Microdochium trichocladiopsis]KAH7025857.1 hypothetical protein B0I36DRAFT_329284 [Microdochium trichocladiopsis]